MFMFRAAGLRVQRLVSPPGLKKSPDVNVVRRATKAFLPSSCHSFMARAMTCTERTSCSVDVPSHCAHNDILRSRGSWCQVWQRGQSNARCSARCVCFIQAYLGLIKKHAGALGVCDQQTGEEGPVGSRDIDVAVVLCPGVVLQDAVSACTPKV